MTDISKLALAGLLGGAIAFGTVSCGAKEEAAPAPTTTDDGGEAAPADADAKYSELHACAGLNSCKGLGGCKVTAEKLEKLAKDVGMDASKAGSAHECKGLNECKGLGGCSVDAAKLEKLKKMKKDG